MQEQGHRLQKWAPEVQRLKQPQERKRGESVVQGEEAFSAGKERSSEENRQDCSANAEGRAAPAGEVRGHVSGRVVTQRNAP
jgi:hypothetical protein